MDTDGQKRNTHSQVANVYYPLLRHVARRKIDNRAKLIEIVYESQKGHYSVYCINAEAAYILHSK